MFRALGKLIQLFTIYMPSEPWQGTKAMRKKEERQRQLCRVIHKWDTSSIFHLHVTSCPLGCIALQWTRYWLVAQTDIESCLRELHPETLTKLSNLKRRRTMLVASHSPLGLGGLWFSS